MPNSHPDVKLQQPSRRRAGPSLLDDADTVVDPPWLGTPLIHLLGRHGSVRRDILNRWVVHGADIHATDALGTTPLMYLARRGDLDGVAYLVLRGALVNVMDRRGHTAFSAAAYHGHRQVMAYLKSRGANPNAVAPLIDAVRGEHLQALQLQLQLGCSADLRDRAGNTPLMVAAMAGRFDAVRLLIASGGSPKARNHRGQDAISLAIAAGHFRIAAYLETGRERWLSYGLGAMRYRWLRWRLASPLQHS